MLTKKRFSFPLLATLCFLLGVQQTVFAKEKWYRVEVIVFAHGTQPSDQENFPETNDVLPTYQTITLKTQQAEMRESTLYPSEDFSEDLPKKNPKEFIALPTHELSLLDAKKRLQQNGHKKILLHTGWRQIALDKKQALGVYLTGEKTYPNHFNDPQPQIEGILRVSLSRYLHVDADFLYRKKHQPKTNKRDYSRRYDRNYYFNESPPQSLTSFRLSDSTKVQPNEVHYLDHPLYGIIVMLSPEEMPEPSPQAENTFKRETLENSEDSDF